MNENRAMFLLCALMAIFVIPSAMFAASFDCSKATTKTEKTICKDPVLSKLDDDLAAAYSKAMKSANSDIVKKEQRKWLKEILAPCQEDKECIKMAYENRLEKLKQDTDKTASDDTITGTYFYARDLKANVVCGLEVQKLPDNKIKFAFDCCGGTPTYNVGYLSDIIALEGQGAAYHDKEHGDCRIEFKFLNNKVLVSQPGQDCYSFGHGVYADGLLYRLKSRGKPSFEVPEYGR